MFRTSTFLLRCLVFFLLLATARSQAQTIPARQFLKQFGPAEGLAQPFVYALAQDQQGYLWLGTAEGLVRYDGTTFRTFTTKDGLAEDFVMRLRFDPQTGILRITHRAGGLTQLRHGQFKKLRPVAVDWTKPDSTAATWARRLAGQLPEGTVVSCTLLDAEGNRWLGTAGQGLWRLTDSHVTFFPLKTQPSALAAVADGLAIGTGRGLLGATPTARAVRLAPLSTLRQPITAARAAGGGLLASTAETGIWQLGGGAAVAHPARQLPQLPPNLRVLTLAPDAAGGLWVGTIGDGAWYVPAGGGPARHFTTANGLLHNDIYTILPDRAGRIWFGTHGTGLAVREPSGRFRVYRLLPGGEDVTALHEDAAGHIWAGTEGDGVYCFEQGKFRQFTAKQGLPSDYCYGFAALPHGDVLLVHRHVLSRYHARTGTFRQLTSPENPLVRELLPNAAATDAADNAWVATRAGLLRLAATAAPAPAATTVALTGAEVDGEARRPRQLGELSATRHRVAWFFRAASLAPAGNWQFQYRLRGLDAQWSHPTTVGEAQFPGLDAGRYTFEVRARLGEQGRWSPPTAAGFSIATPFWRTWWFAALSGAAAAAGIWALVRGREMTLRRQKFQLETTVRERTQELRHQKAEIEEMNVELTVARDAAEASRRAKAQFLANMSHEIRTPMNAVIGLTHLLRQTPMNAEQTEYLTAVQSSSQNLLVIINDILDSSKMEAGKLTLESTPFRLPELLGRVASMFRFATENKGLYFRLDTAPDVPTAVLGDPVRLNQVLVNLIGNAVKFTSTGGVTVRVTVQQGAVTDALVVRFAVQDTGIGLAPNQLEAIFEEFSQASASTTRQFGGTGLGLSIARNLVELHNGRLWVESELGHGATFIFEIPYPVADPALVPAETTLAVGRFEPALRVLVAEDNELNQLVARKTLEAWNVQVTIAANGRLAVEAGGEQEFDAVLMDVQMPEMDGYEASRQLRTRFPDATRFPILGLTASALPEDRALALAAGMNDTLPKPFDPAVLFARLAHFTSAPTVGPDSAEPAAAETPAAPEVPCPLDWTLLEELSGGNEQFMHQIINTFLTQAPQLQEQLETALAAPDPAALARTAHKLKGQVAYFGVETLHAALETLEKQARQGSTPAILSTEVGQITEQLTTLYPHLRTRVLA